ncbi:DsbA family protein [Falsihalocynthiibacter sp. SS001]|uniref:DsbA family protein n=1 Tax=Falsihalocynthiibacter sp. SS001 TaxID=3349698 RepID=UPI0036D2D535
MLSRFSAVVFLSLASFAPAAQAQDLTEERVQELVLETILENPEIIRQAITILQQREEDAAANAAQATLETQRQLLEGDPNAPVLGNPDGDVTVVEFFDYNCPYCKQAGKAVEELIASDPNVRVVYREWPILSEGSVFASRAALASREQGKYEEFHWELMAQRGRLDEASVLKVAEKVGLDIDQLKADMESPEVEEHISTTNSLAKTLGFGGTPSFIIGDELVPGMIELTAMQQLVEAARSAE